ncbi:oleosin H1-like [Cornus florida]|uniref:oleosin H1-like n=1 Tax=Cornus florida TaxID=4283 RepID=UPI002897A4A4|nr:oleosin H1-like [Cornus florida]
MADRDRPHPHQLQVHPQHRYDGGPKSFLPQRGPSATQIMAVITLLPIGGTLLCLAGLTLAGSLIGLAVTTPIFVLFSPILVPAAIGVGLAVTAFLASGAFGVTALSALSWFVKCLRQGVDSLPEQLDQAKRRMQDMAIQMGQKTKDVGQTIQQKAQESGKT